MKSTKRFPYALRCLLLAHLSLLLAFTPARAQTPNPEAAALAKYDKNGNGRLDADELATQQADQALIAGAVSTPAADTPPSKDETLVLSPFEVVANNRGYYGANTMSGTRFNTKLEDLASSITIMTKDQMADLAITDINDVFLYVAGTEGTGTYTDFTLDRNGSISDNVQVNPAQANRVRGIAPANISLGNIETMSRVPIDPIGIDALEISRGPNANVFGLGNPSGTVNQVPSSANLQRNRAQLVLKTDSYDGYRDSLDVNQVLIKNKLAIRAQQVFQHEGFERKPSGVDTERYNFMVKVQPFKNTTVSASYNYYHAYGNRPNSLPPRDNISYWVQNGRPTWDPVARVIHVNGLTSNPITAAAFPSTATFVGETTPRNIDYFSASYLGFNDSQLFIDQNGIGLWSAPAGFAGTSPSGTAQTQRFVQTTGTADARGTGVRSNSQPLFLTTPTVSDKSLYDWENLNIAAVNRFWDKTETYNVQLDQIFLHTDTQTLALQANFFREDSERYTRNFIGIANDLGQSGQLAIDVNERLLDGSPNPFFLRPYISTDKPRTQYDPARWDTTRVQAAYQLDLTGHKNWLKYLGSHQVTGYDEYKYRVNRRYSWRDVNTASLPWIPAGLYRGNQAQIAGTPTLIPATRNNLRYYVGDNVGNNVDYAPTQFEHGDYEFVWGNAATGVFNHDDASLGLGAVTDNTGNTANTKVTIKTLGGVMQSHFLGDRLITTLGARQDKVRTQFGNPNVRLNADGLTHDRATTDGWSSVVNFSRGNTTNVQAVIRPFQNTALARNLGNEFWGELLNNLSLGYNRSDSFLPATPAQTLRAQLLPNPTGKDKSFNLGLNLFQGRLVLRATRYRNVQKDARNSDASVFLQRVTRIDLSPLNQTPNPARLLFQADAWIRAQNPTWTNDQVRTEVTRQTGISPETEAFLFNPVPPFAATADVVAKGTEFEINFNPTKFWTVSASFTDSKATNRNVSADVQSWIDERMPIWTTIVDPRIGAPGGLTPTAGNTAGLWWKQLYAGASGNQTAENNFIAFVGAPYSAFRELEGKANPQTRRYNTRVSTKLDLNGLSANRVLKKVSVGGAVRLESKAAIGYFGVEEFPAKVTKLDTNRPIYDSGHYYVDAFIKYRTTLWADKIGATFQFNVKNLNENGGLRPVGVYPNGVPHTYRIVDPRQFFLQVTFDL